MKVPVCGLIPQSQKQAVLLELHCITLCNDVVVFVYKDP